MQPNKPLQLTGYSSARLDRVALGNSRTATAGRSGEPAAERHIRWAARRDRWMQWDVIGAVAELIGAIGVVASLIYVASQVRSSNRASAVQAKLETTRFMTDYGDMMLEHPALYEVRQRGLADLKSLSPDEFEQFNHLALKAFWFFSAGYFQHRQRTLGEDDWYELRAVARYWLHFQGCRDWWQRVGRFMFGPEFVGFVEDEMATLAAQQGVAADQPQLG